MLQYSIFIYIPSALVPRVPERLRPNAFRPLPKTDRLELEYSCHVVISFIPFFIGVSFKFINGGEHCAASVASVHPHAFFVSVFFPVSLFLLRRNIYNPNLFFRLWCCCGRSSRL